MKKLKGKKGITLIALVITIIILIVLASVAINLSVGENGLFQKAKYAKQQYEIAQAKEYIEIKVDECIMEKGGNATLQDIVDYLSEDSNVTYYVALEEVALVAGEVDVGTPKEIYVVYSTYQFKIEENKNVEFISIVDVDLEGKITIESEVQEYLGKNEEGNYTASILLKATGNAQIVQLEIQNPDGTVLELEKEELIIAGKDMIIEFDKEYKVVLTTENGHKYTKKIIERTEEIIMTAEELANFRDKVNSGLTYEGKTIKLGADIDLSTVCGENVNGEEISWEPIGNWSTNNTFFKGIFDGNNYEISKIYINESKNYQGLFGNNKGTIENVKINMGNIKANGYVGTLAGYNAGIIIKCYAKGNVVGTKQNIGGIIGCSSGGIISKCVNDVNVVLAGTYSNPGNVGGVVGILTNNSILELSYNLANIVSDKAASNMGGVCRI